MEPSHEQQSNSPAIPIAIVVGFAMIAIAIFFTGGRNEVPTQQAHTTTDTESERVVSDGGLPPVDESDYIRGNPNAPILMVEYSDYDCPFCKQFHATMNQIMLEYGVDGRIGWVYRQFPLAQLHPNAPRISEAALCVGDIGGNNAFWQFTDLIFEQREIDEPTNIIKLPDYAERIGIDRDSYQECVRSDRFEDDVAASVEDALKMGARGTPYTVVIAGNEQAVINGAQSYETVRAIVTNLIDQLDGRFNPEATAASSSPTETESEIPAP